MSISARPYGKQRCSLFKIQIATRALPCVSTGNSRNEKREDGEVGNEEQRDKHAEIERKRCLDDLFHRALADGGADKQDRTDRRCEQANATVKYYHNTKLDRIKPANLGGYREKNRRSNENDLAEPMDVTIPLK